jgi:hypothetical protein
MWLQDTDYWFYEIWVKLKNPLSNYVLNGFFITRKNR